MPKSNLAIERVGQMSPEEETRFWKEFENALAHDDGDAAKKHLRAGNPIYIGDDRFPDKAIRKYPDGRCEVVSINAAGEIIVVQKL